MFTVDQVVKHYNTRTLWNMEMHYHFHKNPSLVPTWARLTHFTHCHHIQSRTILILVLHLHLCLKSHFFLSCVPTKTLYALIFPHVCHILHSSLYGPPNNIWPGVRIMMITMQFSQAFCYFLPLRFKLWHTQKLMFVYYMFLKKTKKGNVLKILLKSSVLTFQNINEKKLCITAMKKKSFRILSTQVSKCNCRL